MVSHSVRRILAPLLFPVSLIYGFVTSIRNSFFNLGILKSTEFGFPVISVGNITVGGTGKTPHTEYLLRLLGEKYPVAYLSRGYKRKTKGYILASESSSPDEIGDEAFQISNKFSGIRIAVDENRVHGIQMLKEKFRDLKCVILDDAYQHRYIQAGVSVLLIDYNRPMHKDYLLPAGDLREKRSGIHRANIVIITKVPDSIKPIEKRIWIKELSLYPYQFLYFTTLKYGPLTSVYEKKKKPEIRDLKKYSVLMVTGIANPAPLYEKLKATYHRVDRLCFADHHKYTHSDAENIHARFKAIQAPDKLIITTEKDAVKLRDISSSEDVLKENLYYLPVEVKFLFDQGTEFDENILEYVGKNKRISRLHC
jgi:tetraacyldisaccharide 4'-kinase